MKNGYNALGACQFARLFTSTIYTVTISAPDCPPEVAISLRRSSRAALEKVLNAYSLRSVPADFTRALAEPRDIYSGILQLLESLMVSHGIPEKARRDLVSQCRRLHDEISRIIGSADPAEHLFVSASLRSGESTAGDAPSPQKLEGKVILITRPYRQSQELIRMTERYGGIPLAIPMIEITDPETWEPVDQSIANLQSYDGVIFTSQNAVKKFIARVMAVDSSLMTILAIRRIYAVGEKTRAALEKAGIPVTLMPESYSAGELIFAMQKERLVGNRFLFPKGDIAKDDIPKAIQAQDGSVHEVVVYNTVNPNRSHPGPLRQALENGEIDAVAFFSPSSIQNFSQLASSRSIAGIVAACIGQVTAEEARASGFRVIVTAQEATAESLLTTLADHFESLRNPYPG